MGLYTVKMEKMSLSYQNVVGDHLVLAVDDKLVAVVEKLVPVVLIAVVDTVFVAEIWYKYLSTGLGHFYSHKRTLMNHLFNQISYTQSFIKPQSSHNCLSTHDGHINNGCHIAS